MPRNTRKKQVNLDKLIKISILIGILIITLSVSYYFVFNLSRQKVDQSQEQKTINKEDIKKQALIAFDREISDAIVNKNYEKLYELSPKTTKRYYTKNDFVELKKNNEDEKVFKLVKITTNGVEIKNDQGTVERIFHNCFKRINFETPEQARTFLQENPDAPGIEEVQAKLDEYDSKHYGEGAIKSPEKESAQDYECSENELTENHQDVKYSYLEDEWQMYDPEPSEKSLKLASYYYDNMSKKSQDEAIESWGQGLSGLLATRNFALMLDESPEALARVEGILEKNNKESISNYNNSSTGNTYQDSTSDLDNLIKESDQKRQQDCQEDTAKYNSCLAEYNTKMAEYNSCLNGGSYSSYCSKPFNFCFKPICF